MCQNQDSHWDYKNGYYFLKFDNKKIIGTIRNPLYVGALYIIYGYGYNRLLQATQNLWNLVIGTTLVHKLHFLSFKGSFFSSLGLEVL
jgi:hypothetical protein